MTGERLDASILACLARAADREVAGRLLRRERLEHRLLADVDELVEAAGQGAGVLLVDEGVLPGRSVDRLNAFLDEQPSWSDLPVVLLTSQAVATRGRSGPWTQLSRNVTVIQRPIGSASLISVLTTALQARRRQYEVRDLLAGLEQRVEARTAELERSNQDLEQFAHVASHDLQEPLRMISGFLGLLQERFPDDLDERARHYVAVAVDGAKRMSTLIINLLEFSRVGTRGKQMKPIDAGVPLRWARHAVDAAADEAQAHITTEDLPTVWGDEQQLAQLFQNLLGNAIKFRRRDVPLRVEITAERQDDHHLFRVVDNGIGIDPSQHERVFDIFQRLHTREQYEGTGIGLAICRRIIERHGGRIWVETAPGEGTAFLFTLPAAD